MDKKLFRRKTQREAGPGYPSIDELRTRRRSHLVGAGVAVALSGCPFVAMGGPDLPDDALDGSYSKDAFVPLGGGPVLPDAGPDAGPGEESVPAGEPALPDLEPDTGPDLPGGAPPLDDSGS